MRRRLAALVGLTVSALLLSGCLAIKSVTGVQQDIVGPVRVVLVVCAVDRAPTIHPGCDYQSNLGEGVPGTGQLLIAMRVPAGTVAPQNVVGTTNDASGSMLELTRNSTYESELSRLLPGDGRTWIGYRSSVYEYNGGPNGTPAREVSISIDLTPPRSADGAPYVGSLPVIPVAGGRGVSATASADRSVDCGTNAFASSSDATICVDSPVAVLIDSPYNFPTRDFGVVAGNATASPGQTVGLPFNVRGAGALPAGLTAALSAATTLPGATVAPSLPSAGLASGSDTRVTVPVAIPANAPAGVYDVALTGRLENGQARTGVAKLTVRAKAPVPDVAKPRLTAARVKPKAFRPATKKKPKRGTKVSFTLSEAASVRVVVERCAKRAKPKGKRPKGKRPKGKRRRKGRCVRFAAMRGALAKTGTAGVNSFRFDGRVRRKALKPGAYRLSLTPTDPAANRGARVRAPFTILR